MYRRGLTRWRVRVRLRTRLSMHEGYAAAIKTAFPGINGAEVAQTETAADARKRHPTAKLCNRWLG